MFEKMFGSAIACGFKTIFSPDRGTVNFMLGYLPLFILLELSVSYLNIDSIALLWGDSKNFFQITVTTLTFFVLGVLALCSSVPPYLYISQKIIGREPLSHNYYTYFMRKEFFFLLFFVILNLLFSIGMIALPSSVFGLIGLIGGILFWLFFLVRLSLLIPHVSLGRPFQIKKIFQASRGHFWHLGVSVFVASIPALVFTLGLQYLFPGKTGPLFLGGQEEIYLPRDPIGLYDVLKAFGDFIAHYLSLASIASLADLYRRIIHQGGEPH